jgi:hypothetical protein
MSSVSIIELGDVTSSKLGLPNGSPRCDTCGSQNARDCDGKQYCAGSNDVVFALSVILNTFSIF